MKLWFKSKDISSIIGINKQLISYHCQKGNFEYRQVDNTYEISLESVLKYYVNIGDIDKVEKLQKYISSEADEKENKVVVYKGQTKEQISDKAIAKYQVVRNYLRFIDENRNISKVVAGRLFVENFNKTESELRSYLGEISLQSVYRWLKTLEENNWDIDSLKSKKQEIGRSISIQEREILIPLLLNPNKPLIAEIIKRAKQKMISQGIEPKSDITYRRFIDDWKKENQDIWVLGRYGSKAFNDKILKSIVRDKDQIEVGDILVADGHTMNVMCINPLTGRPARMTLVMFYDFKSDMPVGWEIMPTENIMTIASALRNAIIRLGSFFGAEGYLPKVVYLDNGKAFRSKYFNGTKDFSNTIIPGLFGKLGIETMFATPYHGQSKPVERWFRILGELERRLPAYTGYNIESKPAMLMRNEKLHKRLFDNAPIDIETLRVNLEHFIQEYAMQEHQNGFYKGYTPIEIFMSSINKIKEYNTYQERLISKNELIYLMMSEKDRQISRNGIRFNGKYYWNEIMPSMVGAKVIIRYDIWDDKEIYVFDEKRYLFAATLDDVMIHPAARILGTDEDVEKLQKLLVERQQYKKDLEQQYKEIIKLGDTGYMKIENKKPVEENAENEKPKDRKKNAFLKYAKLAGYIDNKGKVSGEEL